MLPISSPTLASLGLSERAKGTAGTLRGKTSSGGYVMLPPEKREPTLAALGLTKPESAAAQTRPMANH
jgi:hypothetical protein